MVNRELNQYSRLFDDYTELRVQENRAGTLQMVNGDVMANTKTAISGVSARTYKHGVWGFASDSQISDESVTKVIRASCENAKFLDLREKRNGKQLPQGTVTVNRDFSTQKIKKSQKETIDFIREIDDFIKQNYTKISSRTVRLQQLDMEKSLLTSDASSAYTMTPRTFVIASLVIDESEPVSLYEVWGGLGQFEDVFDSAESLHGKLDLLYENLRKKAEGVYPESGIHECVFGSALAGVLAHEAIGHTTEADIVRGGSIAGDYLEQQVASPLISLVDFAHAAFGETCPVPVYVDDEGTKAEDVVLIDRGILKQFMHNKETANYFDTKPTGNARAYQFFDEPLIRMRNTAILPGTSKLKDMISSVKDGYYLIQPGNGQADTTSEFMFAITLGYEIKNGKLGRAIKNTTISGVAFDMLNTVTNVSDDMVWKSYGMCGKKQPIPVGLGGPAIKCKINIGGK